MLALAAVHLGVFLLSRPWAQARHLHDLIALLFVVVAFKAIGYAGDDTRRFGVYFEGVAPGAEGDPRSLVRALVEGVPAALREAAVAAAAAALVFPVYALAWPMFNRPVGPRRWALDGAGWQAVAAELFAVAFAEEVFFRGFVLTRVGDAMGLGALKSAPRAQLAAAVAVTSLFFATTHLVVDPTVARAVVFFPGLLFGALRVWRGGVGAAIVFHAACNLFERYLEGR